MDPAKLFTIGHSTRTLEDFIGLLQREGVSHLADVRAFPTSARYPHFNGANLEASLAQSGIGYSHHPSLGGRRRGKRDSNNTAWRNASFRAYADHMETREFAHALDDLLEIAAREPTAVMCAEAVPWRCHRSLIADAAVARGIPVFHILDAAVSPHKLTSFARIEQGKPRYDSPTEPTLFAT
ncbi:MAG: DUF488 family protein [Gemmatimonadaceae bacterium]